MSDKQGQSTPKQLGRYRIVRRLGAGGMAEVFLAKSTGAEGIEKLLVVKRILPTFARNAKFITMFLEEAKITTRLNHPNIVQVYTFEQVKDEFLMAMEFVDGIDLGYLLKQMRRGGRRMPFGVAAYVVNEVAKGLDYAHKRRDEHGEPMEIVHRDVSPQNVLLTFEGAVKVADFGIARARLISEDTGVIKGKFSYMSPEQARGHRVDSRSDVYALGVLLAELLMGRAMYPGKQGLDVLEQVREGHLTLPREVDPHVSVALDEIVRRATTFDREERFQSARALSAALSQYLHQQEHLIDGQSLEQFIAENVPRDATSPETTPSAESGQAATIASALIEGNREVRERRHVVVVTGRARRDGHRMGDGEQLGDEAMRLLDAIAYRADAVLSWPEGKGAPLFRLVLGLRRASVHDPLSSLHLAMDLIDAVEGLSADLLRPIGVSVGVSRGVVATVRDTGGRLLKYDPMGGVFDVADRLAEVGEASMVLVAGEVYRLTRRLFAFEELAERVSLSPTGQAGPSKLRAHRLRGARTREERAAELVVSPGASVLVGRDEELRFFRASYDEVVEGARSAFLAVTGDLGVGKSSLVAQAIAQLNPAPLVLHAECAFGTRDLPYAAIAEVFRDAMRLPDDASPDDARARVRSGIERLFGQGAVAREVADNLEPLLVPMSTGNDGRTSIREQSITRASKLLLRALSAEQPLVVWIDALQWADTPSLELIGGLMQRTYDVPMLLVVSSRPEPRADRVVSLANVIDLKELGAPEAAQLVKQRLQVDFVPPDVEQDILERAGGNPFFLIELIDALLDRQAITVETEGGQRVLRRDADVAIALPTTLEGVVAARLDELPDRQRHAMRWLAAVGPGMRAEELRQVTGEDCSAELDALRERGLLEMHGDTYRFPSAVIRHVAYETTDKGDAVRMHRRIGHYLKRQPNVPPGRLARHLERAGDRRGAVDAYLEAARFARVVYSNREALRFYARALALLDEDTEKRFAIHAAREDIFRRLGRYREESAELRAMKKLAERTRRDELIAVAYNRTARHELDGGRTRGVRKLLANALASAERAGDVASEVESLMLRSLLAREVGDSADALASGDRALQRVGHSAELRELRGQVLSQHAALLRLVGRVEEALQAASEALVIFRRVGSKSYEANALNTLGVSLAAAGEWEDAITTIRASIALDREAGDQLRLGRKLSNVGQLYAELGAGDIALGYLERALQLFEVVPDASGECDARAALADTLLEFMSDTEGALVHIKRARELAEQLDSQVDLARERTVRARLERRLGHLDRAEEAAREAVALATACGAVGQRFLAQAAHARVLALMEQDADAFRIVRALQNELPSSGLLERAELVHALVAETLEDLGRTDDALNVRKAGRAMIQERTERIRDPEIRARYRGCRTVLRLAGEGA